MPLLNAFLHVAVVSLASYGIGRMLLRRRWLFSHPALQIGAESAIGLILVSYFVLILAFFRQSSPNGLLGLFLVLAGFACTTLIMLSKSQRLKSSLPRGKDWLPWLVAAIPLAVYAGWIVACVLLPPSDRDELIYHLEIPRQFLAHGGLVRFRDNIYGYFPQLGEMLFLFGMGVSGELTAKLYHGLCGFLTALALYGFSRITLDRKHAGLAVFVFLTVPLVLATMPLAYVDLSFGLWTFLAFVCLLEFFKSNRFRWVVLGGIFAGACMATKYTGIQVLILMACLILIEHLRKRRTGLPYAAGILAVAALPLFLPYLYRNWSLTGWPLFPFAAGSFSDLRPGLNWDPERARLYLAWLGTFGAPLGGQTVWHVLAAPVLVFFRGKFNDPQFYEGVMGPVFLLIPVFLALQKGKKNREIAWIGLFSLLFLYYWAFTTRQSRFLIPILPLLCYLLVYGLWALRKTIAYILVGILILFNLGSGMRETFLKHPLPYWFARETRTDYLARQWAGFILYREANKRLGPLDTLYLIHMKNYLYYLDMPVRTDLVFERYSLDQAIREKPTPTGIADFFGRNQITHLLIDEAFALSPDWGFRAEDRAPFLEFLNFQAEPVVRYGSFALYHLKTVPIAKA